MVTFRKGRRISFHTQDKMAVSCSKGIQRDLGRFWTIKISVHITITHSLRMRTFKKVCNSNANHGRWETLVSSIRNLIEIKYFKTFADVC